MKILSNNSAIKKIKEGKETVILKMQIEKDITDTPLIFSFTKKNLIIERVPNSIILPSVYSIKEWKEDANSSISINTEEHYSVQSIIVEDKNNKVEISITFKDGKNMNFIETL